MPAAVKPIANHIATGKHGEHRYATDGPALDRGAVADRFAVYTERFALADEAARGASS